MGTCDLERASKAKHALAGVNFPEPRVARRQHRPLDAREIERCHFFGSQDAVVFIARRHRAAVGAGHRKSRQQERILWIGCRARRSGVRSGPDRDRLGLCARLVSRNEPPHRARSITRRVASASEEEAVCRKVENPTLRAQLLESALAGGGPHEHGQGIGRRTVESRPQCPDGIGFATRTWQDGELHSLKAGTVRSAATARTRLTRGSVLCGKGH